MRLLTSAIAALLFAGAAHAATIVTDGPIICGEGCMIIDQRPIVEQPPVVTPDPPVVVDPEPDPQPPVVVVPTPEPSEPSDITVTVADIAGHGLEAYPVTAVIPYAKGAETACSGPQARMMNEWLDGSVRHCAVTWLASAGAQEPAASDAIVTVESGNSELLVDTGPLQFTVPVAPFTLIGTAAYEGEAVLTGIGGFVDSQLDSDRDDVTVTVEESGPVRVTIKACAPTKFDRTTVTHGWCVRLYAYAGKPWIDIDYQLQNSAKVSRSMPLYFEQAGLRLLAEGATAAGVLVTDGNSRDACMIEAGVATVMLRHCWERFPSGVSVDADGLVTVDMWPDIEGRHIQQDMQHTVREVRIQFGPATAEDYDRFTFPPVAMIPPARYAATRATLGGYGGLLPKMPPETITVMRPYDNRGPLKTGWRPGDRYKYNQWGEPGNITGTAAEKKTYRRYQLGNRWLNLEGGRRWHSCETGDNPPAGWIGIRRGNVGNTALNILHARATLDALPQWFHGWRYEDHWSTLPLSEVPYCGGYWRANDESGRKGYAENLGKAVYDTFADARDDQHGWHSNIYGATMVTADPWLLDWWAFVAEFRKPHMTDEIQYVNNWGRGYGHMIHNALDAYRVTGDGELLAMIAANIKRLAPQALHPVYGHKGRAMKGDGFQTGYILRSLIDAYYELEGFDEAARAVIWNTVAAAAEGNLRYWNYPYFAPKPKIMDTGARGLSSGSGQSLIDPVAWYLWHAGRRDMWEHLERYRNEGLGGGKKPNTSARSWTDYYGMFAPIVTPAAIAARDWTPPPAPVITRDGDRITVTAVGRVHVVCGDKPISINHIADVGEMMNWWFAKPVLPDDDGRYLCTGKAAAFTWSPEGNMAGVAE